MIDWRSAFNAVFGNGVDRSRPDLNLRRGVPLVGKRLRYLIACDDQIEGASGCVVEVGYNGPMPRKGIGVRYCNLYDQTKSSRFGPYADATDTARKYGERVLDWRGKGWPMLLDGQLDSAEKAGFDYVEWDNPDGYPIDAVIDACDRAHSRGMNVFAKNPNLLEEGDARRYIMHPSIAGIIVEQDDDVTPRIMNKLRSGREFLPVWFVSFGDQLEWARAIADCITAADIPNMFVTYSAVGEYVSSKDVIRA